MNLLPKNPSTGLVLLAHIWKNQKGKSWDSINHSMLYALRLGIGSHLEFTAADIAFAESNFRTGYWLGEHGWEYPYALAVSVENTSFIQAFEEHAKREPFFANKVDPLGSEGFTHLTGNRARCRLTLECAVIVGDRPGRVSSITNERVVIVLREFRDQKRSILKLSHDACRKLWPAPKKVKFPAWGSKIIAAVKLAGGCSEAVKYAHAAIAANAEDATELKAIPHHAREWARDHLGASDFPESWAKILFEDQQP